MNIGLEGVEMRDYWIILLDIWTAAMKIIIYKVTHLDIIGHNL